MADYTDKPIPNFSDITREDLAEVMKQGNASRKYLEEKFEEGLNTVVRKLHTSIKQGVMGFEDELLRRRETFGANSIPLCLQKSFLRVLLNSMKDWILIVLAIGALLSLILGLVFPEMCDEQRKIAVAWYEGVGILVMVIVMVFISALSDYLKDSDFRYQEKRVHREQTVIVVRGGDIKEILRANLTVGDLCIVEAGSVIPGDGFVVQSSDLVVNEALLVNGGVIGKDVQGDPLLFSGTYVTQGSGRFIVLAVGQFTQAAQNTGNTKTAKPASNLEINVPYDEHHSKENLNLLKTSRQKGHHVVLEAKINRIATAIGYIGLIIAVITMLVIIIRFSIYTYSNQQLEFHPRHINEYVRAFIMGLVVLIVSVPEGLPLAVTFALAFSTKMMYQNQSLVRHMEIIETMGNITNICCNKTGVLTEQRMHVTKLYTTSKILEGDPRNYKGNIPSNLFEELCKGIAINTSYMSRILPPGPDKLPVQAGNMTDCAVLQFIIDIGETYQVWRDEHPQESFTKHFEFTPERKSMTTVTKSEKGVYKVYSKGAAEVILPNCTTTYSTDGSTKPFTKEDVERVQKEIIKPMQEESLRILCLAGRSVHEEDGVDFDNENAVVSNLTLLAVVGIEDPIREEVPDAIDKCTSAGIRVCMVTGDHVNTARAVAVKCGIIRPEQENLMYDGLEFNKYIRDPDGQINSDRFDSLWPNLRVLARSSARDKYTLVRGIMESHVQRQGEIVAVTGSGIHDGSVLRKADVGFTMGVAGSDVAKENSDVVLLNDNFGSIVWAIKWGRNVYNTVVKFLQFQFTVTWSAFIVIVIGACIFGRSPLVATQMLWINLIMDSLASFALTRDVPSDDLLKYKPYGRHKPVIGRSLIRNVVGHVIFQVIVTFALIFYGDDLLDIEDGFLPETLCKPTQHSSLVFTTFVFMQLFNEINSREVHGRNVFQGIHKNFAFIIIWLLQVIVQILIIELFTSGFHTAGMEAEMWLWCLFFGVSELLWAQIIFSIPKTWLPMAVRCGATGTQKARQVNIFRNTSRVSQKYKPYYDRPGEMFELTPLTPAGSLPNSPEEELWRGPSMEKLEVMDKRV